MEKNNFIDKKLTLVHGGLKDFDEASKSFLSAYITDTRLMGVIGLHIHWTTSNCHQGTDLHQFFLIELEEFGLDTYVSLWDSTLEEVQGLERSLIGPLGGRKVRIGRKEACSMISQYIDFNQNRKLSLPTPISEYKFLSDEMVTLSHKEQELLFHKQCSPIESENQLIHYFIMRCLGGDSRTATYLSNGQVPVDLYDHLRPGVLYRNSITEKDGAFVAQSLIEFDDEYYVCISRFKVEDLHISLAELKSFYKITPTEVAMMLAMAEYVTIFDLACDPLEIKNDEVDFEFNTTLTTYPSGRLYTAFNSRNKHVDSPVFVLNEDILGMHFLSNSGQLFLVAYSPENIQLLERKFLKSNLINYVIPNNKFEFTEPVILSFINSPMDTFEDFLELMGADSPYDDDEEDGEEYFYDEDDEDDDDEDEDFDQEAFEEFKAFLNSISTNFDFDTMDLPVRVVDDDVFAAYEARCQDGPPSLDDFPEELKALMDSADHKQNKNSEKNQEPDIWLEDFKKDKE